jgi:hypothetical protein
VLLKLAQLATNRAHRTGNHRDLNRAWFLRSLASWLKGGEWSAMPPQKPDRRVLRDRARRQSAPRVETVIGRA